MKKVVNLGIIGCGHWGPNFVRNFSHLPGAHVCEVSDLNIERLMHIKRLYPSVKISQDYERLLGDDKLDAIIIATPAVTHYKIAKECLHKNKHVLVEKPIALKVNEAEELIRLSQKRKRVLMVGHTFLYNPAINKMQKLIKKGELGRIYYFYSTRTNLGPLRTDINAMWDLAPHDISIFSYLLDSEPYQVAARGGVYLQENMQDVAFITLNYPNKVVAHIHVSWLDPRKIRTITMVGDQKMVVFNDLDNKEPIRVYDKRVMKKRHPYDYDTFEEFKMIIQEREVAIPRIKMIEPLKDECHHFLDCIVKNKVPLTDGNNGLKVLKVLIAIQRSLNKDGKIVPVG